MYVTPEVWRIEGIVILSYKLFRGLRAHSSTGMFRDFSRNLSFIAIR